MSYGFLWSYISLVKLIPRYFTLLDVLINRTVFFISLPGKWLLKDRNATDFYIWILYPATLLNSFISSNRFLVESLGFSIYCIMSSENSNIVTLKFSTLFSIYRFHSLKC